MNLQPNHKVTETTSERRNDSALEDRELGKVVGGTTFASGGKVHVSDISVTKTTDTTTPN